MTKVFSIFLVALALAPDLSAAPNIRSKDPYERLGIERGASQREADEAYYALLRIYQPKAFGVDGRNYSDSNIKIIGSLWSAYDQVSREIFDSEKRKSSKKLMKDLALELAASKSVGEDLRKLILKNLDQPLFQESISEYCPDCIPRLLEVEPTAPDFLNNITTKMAEAEKWGASFIPLFEDYFLTKVGGGKLDPSEIDFIVSALSSDVLSLKDLWKAHAALLMLNDYRVFEARFSKAKSTLDTESADKIREVITRFGSKKVDALILSEKPTDFVDAYSKMLKDLRDNLIRQIQGSLEAKSIFKSIRTSETTKKVRSSVALGWDFVIDLKKSADEIPSEDPRECILDWNMVIQLYIQYQHYESRHIQMSVLPLFENGLATAAVRAIDNHSDYFLANPDFIRAVKPMLDGVDIAEFKKYDDRARLRRARKLIQQAYSSKACRGGILKTLFSRRPVKLYD